MGKVKIKTLGDETTEQKQKAKEQEKREQKKAREASGDKTVDLSPTEQELKAVAEKAAEIKSKEEVKKGKKESTPIKSVSKYKEETKKATRSKSYTGVAAKVEANKPYSLTEALKLLPELKRAKFDETVELHINTTEQGVSGSITLPHGTGKQIRVAIADDAILAQVEKGKIDFDILLAHPSMMPKLAKVARVLGPKGLMPNPKNGTVTPTPEEAAKKYQGGMMNFKTEAKSPIIHLVVGKVSFGDKKLEENITTIMGAIPPNKIRNITLKSTMSPAIRVTF